MDNVLKALEEAIADFNGATLQHYYDVGHDEDAETIIKGLTKNEALRISLFLRAF